MRRLPVFFDNLRVSALLFSEYFELGFECYVLILQILILIGLLEQLAAQFFDFADIFHISLYGFL